MSGIDTVYIVSAGRPECKTARLLERLGYSGEWYVCVNEYDVEIDSYRANWEDRLLTYSYSGMVSVTDMLDPFIGGVHGAAPARNGVMLIARGRNDRRFWMLDDDITAFTVPKQDSNGRTTLSSGDALRQIMRMISEWADECGISCVGAACDMQAFPPKPDDVNWYVRQMYNLSSDAPAFRSRMEEDLCYACDGYRRGQGPFIALRLLGIRLMGVCDEGGGCTEVYNEYGTIRRAAYNILVSPLSQVKCDRFGYSGFPRWKHLVPKILREKHARTA